MCTIEKGDFRPALVVLFRECFEGIPEGASGTWFVQGKEGIFDALESVSARQASAKPVDGLSSIAGHVNHVLFALQLGNAHIGGTKPKGTWETSWDVQSVDETDWSNMKATIMLEYDFFMNWLATNDDWSYPDNVTGSLAQLPHMSYHLGAIRQLMKL